MFHAIITKQRPSRYKKYKEKESKHTTKESHQTANGKTGENERDRNIIKHPENNLQNTQVYIHQYFMQMQ